MIKQNRLHWFATIIAFATFACMTISYLAPMSAEANTWGETYPEFSEGILKSAKLEKMENGLLLKADGFEIKDSFIEEYSAR
jgi:hypothetical protein